MKRFALIKLLLVAVLIIAAMPQQAQAQFQYIVKFVCGKSDGTILAPGEYRTAINVINPTNGKAYLYKHFSIALPLEKIGPVTPDSIIMTLGRHESMEIDCKDIRIVTAKIVEEAKIPTKLLKGFVLIWSNVELEVVAVYTATITSGTSRTSTLDIDVERVPPRRLR